MFNLTEQTKQSLEKSLDSKSRCCHLAIHAELLVLLGSNWLDYVEYLSTELRKHVSSKGTRWTWVLLTSARAIKHAIPVSIDLISTTS